MTTYTTMSQCIQGLYAAIDPPLPTLYLEEVPEDVPQIRGAYYVHEGEVPVWGTGNKTAPNQVVGRFTIAFFSESSTTVETNALTLRASFNYWIQNALPMAYNNVDQKATMVWRRYALNATKLRDENGAPIYMAAVSYEMSIGKPPV